MPADPYKADNPASDTMVILTNGNVNEPLGACDGYDARSEIENSLFREAKTLNRTFDEILFAAGVRIVKK